MSLEFHKIEDTRWITRIEKLVAKTLLGATIIGAERRVGRECLCRPRKCPHVGKESLCLDAEESQCQETDGLIS